jgi:hypothetical protein
MLLDLSRPVGISRLRNRRQEATCRIRHLREALILWTHVGYTPRCAHGVEPKDVAGQKVDETSISRYMPTVKPPAIGWANKYP